jgi:hypothetical protein
MLQRLAQLVFLGELRDPAFQLFSFCSRDNFKSVGIDVVTGFLARH